MRVIDIKIGRYQKYRRDCMERVEELYQRVERGETASEKALMLYLSATSAYTKAIRRLRKGTK